MELAMLNVDVSVAGNRSNITYGHLVVYLRVRPITQSLVEDAVRFHIETISSLRFVSSHQRLLDSYQSAN